MATVEDDDSPAEGETAALSETGLLEDYGVDRVMLAVAGVVVLALALRFFALGQRIAHWDEARVSWWIMDYARTGNFEYRPIIHGPFYHHVNRFLFGALGANDATMRLVIAAIGGIIPAAALGLRHRLRDVEVVGLAVFLAVNPLLLYYSRFMRGDPVVAFFMFAAFVSLVRLVDFGKKRYLFLAVGLIALAFTGKENALLYLVTWIGATALILDHRLLFADERGHDWTAILGGYVRTTLGTIWEWLPYLLFALVQFVVIIAFFYAPRASAPEALGLWNAFGDPSMFPDVIEEATVGSWEKFYGLWVSGGHQDHPYLPFLGDYVQSLGYGGLSVTLLAIVGFVADRYSENGPSDLVSFCFYWGFASVLGYPIVTDIKAPWAAMHAVIAFVVPAAVGLGLIIRWGRGALLDDDRVGVGIAALLLLVVFGQVAGAGAWLVYMEPKSDSNEIVQYAQPAGDLRPVLTEMRAASADNDGTDVLMYGEFFVDGDASATRTPACVKWFNALPLPWYFSTHESDVQCAENKTSLERQAADQPPIVIGEQKNREELRELFPNYRATTYELRTYGTETVFLIHPDYVQRESEAGA
jgi:uncharacterized protein (TIGR03663 family)